MAKREKSDTVVFELAKVQRVEGSAKPSLDPRWLQSVKDSSGDKHGLSIAIRDAIVSTAIF